MRDLKNELLGLPLKAKLQPGVVPSLHLVEVVIENPLSDQDTEVKTTRTGRVIKRKLPPLSPLTNEKSPKKPKKPAKEKRPAIVNQSSDHGYTMPTGINALRNRILELKEELVALREKRMLTTPEPSPMPSISITPMKDVQATSDHLESKREVSADDVRNRFRAAVGLKTQCLKRCHLKSSHPEYKVSKEDENKLFYVALDIELKGSPQLTANYFVSKLIDESNLKNLKSTKSELLQALKDKGVPAENDSIMLMDKKSHHLWNLDMNASAEVLKPLKKLVESPADEANGKPKTRPRERYLADRKTQWLEPELKKWKDRYDELRKYRKQELSKCATMKMARLKRNAKRKRRREWIQNQVKEGKLHKSALIWVNSNKILPFEKEEKERLSKSNKNASEDLDDIDDEEDQLDDVQELQDAIDSIKEPKELLTPKKNSTRVIET